MADLKERAATALAAVETELRDISLWMYENPELAFEEHRSSARLVAFLSDQGFDVEYPAYGLDTAFAARVGSDGPEIVICAEYDALPGVGHACGHNIIATAALGAGAALVNLADELGIRITVLGTPAEEHIGGKVDLIKAGAFTDTTAAMMIHPSPMDVLDAGVLAISQIDVDFHGKDSHASYAPQLGVNALDAFVQSYVNISTLRQHLYPTDKIHGIITKGGEAPNIIPSFTSSSWYVRADTQQRLDELLERVEACFAAGAQATGCTYDLRLVGHTYSDLISNPIMAEAFNANALALGRSMVRGKDLPPGATGSTDMGNVSHEVPAIHPMLSIDSLPAVNHQPEFAALTVTEAGERAIHDGALAMAWTIVDLTLDERWAEL
jgi:amidohydrolase